jgi:hypothetical protein
MNTAKKFTTLGWSISRCSALLRIFFLLSACALSVSLRAQDAPPPPVDEPSPPASEASQPAQENGNGNGGRQRRNFSPDAMMKMLQTRFGVTDDAEWAVISARITPIMELRRGAMGGGFRMGGGGGGGRNADPAVTALRSAIADNMPDAEIKARLERLRESRKDDQAKLEKAQADLVAVLTVKQEAIAVMMGLVP